MIAEIALLVGKMFILLALLPFVVLFALAGAAITIWSLINEVWRAWPK